MQQQQQQRLLSRQQQRGSGSGGAQTVGSPGRWLLPCSRVSVRATQAPPAPTASEAAVTVSWRFRYRCKFGEHVAIVGGHEQLGAWEPQQAVPLTWSEGDQWIGKAAFGTGMHLEYKYIVCSSNGSLCYWQPGPNVVLQLEAAPGARLVVAESWAEPKRSIEVQQPQPQQVQPKAPRPSATAQPAPAAPQSSTQQTASTAGTARPPAAASQPPPAAPQPATSAPAAPEPSQESPAAPAAPSPPRRAEKSPLAQQADKSIADLQQVLSRHAEIQQRVNDPTCLEVLQADRLMAAANNKAVAMNKALQAADAFPQLPAPSQLDRN